MNLEVLVSALNKDPEKLLGKMNIQSPAVVVNQCDRNMTQTFFMGEHEMTVISSTERGVGKSRNECLSRASADLVLFSDDDIIYYDGYHEKIIKEFEALPEADIILFNMEVCEERRTYWNSEVKKIGKTNCGRFPAYSIAAKRESLTKAGIRFSLLFGGGAKYSNGEDSLFLTDALRAGLKIYSSVEVLGKEAAGDSTWFKGFNEKFFFDRGVLFAFLYRGFAPLWAFRFVFLKKNIDTSKVGKKKAWQLIRNGIQEGNRLRKEEANPGERE